MSNNNFKDMEATEKTEADEKMKALREGLEEYLAGLVIPKTKDGLLRLFVKIAEDRCEYRFDPRRMILDVLPLKDSLFKVFMPHQEYSLSQSMEDYGQLTVREHRFINFIKYTNFTQEEIDKVFEAYESTRSTLENPQVKTPPEKWQYTMGELFSFLKEATTPPLVLKDEDVISNEELEKLYSKEVPSKKKMLIH